jgi:hypothetical protein
MGIKAPEPPSLSIRKVYFYQSLSLFAAANDEDNESEGKTSLTG